MKNMEIYFYKTQMLFGRIKYTEGMMEAPWSTSIGNRA
jgi:hypothetical protein